MREVELCHGSALDEKETLLRDNFRDSSIAETDLLVLLLDYKGKIPSLSQIEEGVVRNGKSQVEKKGGYHLDIE